jgi:hypothetical protein
VGPAPRFVHRERTRQLFLGLFAPAAERRPRGDPGHKIPTEGDVPGGDGDHAPTSFWSPDASGGCGCASESGRTSMVTTMKTSASAGMTPLPSPMTEGGDFAK